MIYPFSDIPGTLRSIRRQRKLTLGQLSKELGISIGSIIRAERGHDVRLQTALEIAHFLDLELVLVPRRLLSTLQTILAGTASSETDENDATDEDVYEDS